MGSQCSYGGSSSPHVGQDDLAVKGALSRYLR
jgi:hypothetical protein